jgi:hypothetical protein
MRVASSVTSGGATYPGWHVVGRTTDQPPLKRMMRGGEPEENIDACLRM